MKEIQFLLLDAGPIIKLFELGIWESFIRKYDVTIARTVAEQAVFIGKDDDKEYIDFALAPWAQKGLIKIVDVALSAAKTFYVKFDPQYKDIIHEGEKETLAFLCDSSESYQLCSADRAVFRVLGLLGKSDQGISLEEILRKTGLSQTLEWQYTKRFREKYTLMGRVDSIQGKGLI